MQGFLSYFNDPRFIPHGFCLLWRPDVLALHVISDFLIAASYFSIPLTILWFVRRRQDLLAEHRRVAVLFGVFILGCGLTHVFGIIVLWTPLYLVDGWLKALTAVASVITALALWPMAPRLLKIPSPSQLTAANAALEQEIAARRQALEALELIRAGLETEVERRTAEVKALARRFEIATSGSLVSLSEQDDALRYTWAHNPRLTDVDMIGRTDAEVFGAAAAATLTPLKRKVLETGLPLRTETMLSYGGEEHHQELQVTPVEVGAHGRGLLIASIDITGQKREQAHLQLILRELAHRAKNLLSLVEGVARQTVKAEGLPREFSERFGKRLSALGAAYDLLISHDWRGIDLQALVSAQLAHVTPDGSGRVVVSGPPVVVGPEAGQYLALAMHELATNATKYGVLGQGEGRLEVSWRLEGAESGQAGDGERRLVLTWTESGGAPASDPLHSGFGRQLLEIIVPRALRGQARMDFGAEGLSWRMSFVH